MDPMIEAIHYFPHGFLWGCATAAHQVEGDNTRNDWWAWEKQPGRIQHAHRSGLACDWWAGRWEQDLDLAVAGGQNAHRLSIEWSRIEPQPGKWDRSAIDTYRQILQGAQARGLKPLVTLHHFTNPLWFAEMGGWLAAEAVDWFVRYVACVVGDLSDLVDTWITINEPNVLAYGGYMQGVFPPGEQNLGKTLQVMRQLILAHAAAYHTIHELQPAARVGLAHHYRGMQPARPQGRLLRAAIASRSRLFNSLVPDTLASGRLRLFGRSEQLRNVAGTQDFFGLNYYTLEEVDGSIFSPKSLLEPGSFPPGADLSPGGFIANQPQGFYHALRWAHGYQLPIMITENGTEDGEDSFRRRYLVEHLRQVWRAANFNWQVQGYFHWTLVDNFEWERGWTHRFGLYALDPSTQERLARPSAALYAEICKQNALSSQMVASYAPEVLERLFPGSPPGEIQPRSRGN